MQKEAFPDKLNIARVTPIYLITGISQLVLVFQKF